MDLLPTGARVSEVGAAYASTAHRDVDERAHEPRPEAARAEEIAAIVGGRNVAAKPYGADGNSFSEATSAALSAWSAEKKLGSQFVTRSAAAAGYGVTPEAEGIRVTVTRRVEGDPPVVSTGRAVLYSTDNLERNPSLPVTASLQSRRRSELGGRTQSADLRLAYKTATGKDAPALDKSTTAERNGYILCGIARSQIEKRVGPNDTDQRDATSRRSGWRLGGRRSPPPTAWASTSSSRSRTPAR